MQQHLPSALTDPLAVLPGLDARIGRASTGGNEQLYRRLLRMFCASQRDAVEQFQAARARGDVREAKRIAHNLRTVSASLGMTALAPVSRCLETACDDDLGDDAKLAPLLADVARALAGVLAGLDALHAV